MSNQKYFYKNAYYTMYIVKREGVSPEDTDWHKKYRLTDTQTDRKTKLRSNYYKSGCRLLRLQKNIVHTTHENSTMEMVFIESDIKTH